MEPFDDPDVPQLPLPRRVIGWDAVVAGFLGGRPTSTFDSYSRTLREWTAWCASQSFEPLEANNLDVQRWADELAGRHKPSTVERKVITVRGAYKKALRVEAIRLNPADDVRTPIIEEEHTTAVALSDAHLVRLVATAIDAGTYEHAALMLYFTTGLRASEPANADVSDFREDLDPAVLRVRRKGGKRAAVPLAPATAAAIAAYLGDRRSGPLLVSPATGQRLSRFGARRIVMRIAKRAALPRGVTTHTLRHAYVTQAGNLEVPLEAVQDGAGHANPQTTRRYDRARQKRALSSTSTVADWLQLELDGCDISTNEISGNVTPETATSDVESQPPMSHSEAPAQNGPSVRPDEEDSDA